MTFTAFNLERVVDAYNAQTGSHLNKEHDFGFVTLKTNLLKEFERYGSRAGQSNVDSATESSYQSMMREVNKQRPAVWYNKQQERLAKRSFWRKVQGSCFNEHAKRKIELLRDSWARHQVYAHYTSEALWVAATPTLAYLEKFQRYAQMELKKKSQRLPHSIREAYGDYLVGLERDLYQARESMCWSMLARLQAADADGDLTVDDIIVNALSEIEKNLPFEAASRADKSLRSGLNPELFANFHRYIAVYGNASQQQAVQSLSWFQPSSHFTQRPSDFGPILVPSQFIRNRLVPVSVKLPWLFPAAAYRSRFFDEKLFLMARVSKLQEELVPEQLSFERWRSLFDGYNDTDEKLRAIDLHVDFKAPKGIMRWIYRSMNRFVETWLGVSHQWHAEIRSLKSQSLQAYSRYLSEHYGGCYDLEMRLSVDELAQVLSEARQMLQASRDTQERLQLSACVSVFDDFMQRLNDEADDFEVVDHELAREYQSQQAQDVKTQGVLETLLNVDVLILSDAQFKRIEQSLKGVIHSVKNSKDIAIHDLTDKVRERIFGEYLRACLLNPEAGSQKVDSQRVRAVELLLAQFSDPNINKRIATLQSLREQKGKAYLFQITCQSYMKSHNVACGSIPASVPTGAVTPLVDSGPALGAMLPSVPVR